MTPISSAQEIGYDVWLCLQRNQGINALDDVATGFSTGGATREDIKLFSENVTGGLKIKAAGGIATIADAEDFVALGADRLGTSRIVKIVKAEEKGAANDKEDTSY